MLFVLCFHDQEIPRWPSGEESTCKYRRRKRLGFCVLGQEDPLEEKMATHCSILAWTEEAGHGQRRLAGHSLWGCKESDTTERLSTA